MNLYQRIIGHPWVFEHVRPIIVGGIDMSPAYERLDCDDTSVVLDIGCGAGDALRYLSHFQSYVGLDTDERAIQVAHDRYGQRGNVRFECRPVASADLMERPVTHVVMVGLLHHLSNTDATTLLTHLSRAPSIRRIVSLDVVYLPGRYWNNLMAFLDRGRFCRNVDGYLDLVRRAGMRVLNAECVPSHPKNGRVDYVVMELEVS